MSKRTATGLFIVIVGLDSWTGKKDSSNSPLADANSQLENEINYLGFEDDNSGYSHLNDAINDCKSFGEKDKVWTVVVIPVDQDAYNKHQVVLPDDHWLQSHPNAKTYANSGDHLSSPDQISPAELVYGLGYLPADASVVWGVRPSYKIANDGTAVITNRPTIEVIQNGVIKQTFKDSKKSSALTDLLKLAFSNDLLQVAGNYHLTTQSEVKINKGGQLPDPISLIKSIPDYKEYADTPITDSQTIKDTLSKNFVGEWLIAPDVNQLGYQVAYYRIRPKETTPETKNQIMQALFEAEASSETPLDQLRELLMNRGALRSFGTSG